MTTGLALPWSRVVQAASRVKGLLRRRGLLEGDETGCDEAPSALSKDVPECERCGGRMRIIATVTDPEAVRKILACIGLPARPPPIAPAREREQAALSFDA